MFLTRKTLIATAVSLAITSPVWAVGSLIDQNGQFETDTSLSITMSTTTESNSANRYAGMSSANGAMSVEIAEGATLTVTNDSELPASLERLYGAVAQTGSSLTVTGDTVFNLTDEKEIRAIRANGGDMSFNGNTLINVKVDSTNTAIGVEAWEGAHLTFDGIRTELNVQATGGRIIGVQNFNNEGSPISFNAETTIIKAINAADATNTTQGILAYQSTTNVAGDFFLTVKGGVGDTYGIDVQCDPGLPYDTIVNLNGKQTVIDVSATENVYAVRPSGSTGSINFGGDSVIVKAFSTNSRAIGINSQYGAGANVDAQTLRIEAEGKTAYGILTETYGGENTEQFGTTTVSGDAQIVVKGDSAYGVATQVDSDFTPDMEAENQGTYLLGNTTIDVTATAEDGEAVGVMASNASGQITPTAVMHINSAAINVVGQNGAQAVGVLGTSDAKLAFTGDVSVDVQGENSVGMQFDSSDIAISGQTKVQAETALIVLEGAEINVSALNESSERAGLELVGNVRNEGTIQLIQADLSVSGITETAELGTIAAQDSALKVGAGSYNVASLTGGGNELVLTDLANIEAINIQTKDGSLRMVADGNSNDQYASAQDAAAQLIGKVAFGTDSAQDANSFTVEAGDVNNALTGDIVTDSSGNMSLSNVKETKNSKLDAFGSVNALSVLGWRHEINTLNKRMGELRDAPAGIGSWVRLYGSEMEYGDQGVTSKNTTIQVGTDVSVGDWKFGIAANYTDGEATYDAGSADTKNYGVALYGTWFVPCGAYVDLIAKYNRLDNDFALNGMEKSHQSYWPISHSANGSVKTGPFAFRMFL